MAPYPISPQIGLSYHLELYHHLPEEERAQRWEAKGAKKKFWAFVVEESIRPQVNRLLIHKEIHE